MGLLRAFHIFFSFFFWSAAGPTVLGTDADRGFLGGIYLRRASEALLCGTSTEVREGKERGREGGKRQRALELPSQHAN